MRESLLYLQSTDKDNFLKERRREICWKDFKDKTFDVNNNIFKYKVVIEKNK